MKIIIADKQPIYRDGLKHNLEKMNPSAVILDASSTEQITDILRRNNDIDLILADIDIMRPDWESKIRQWLNDYYVPKIGVMSEKQDFQEYQKAQHIGLCCYLPKNIEIDALCHALNAVLCGKSCYPQIINNHKTSNNHDKKLTNRQFEVLKYLSQGLSNKQIAYHMNVSEATVKLHINALLRVIEATNRTQAVIKSQQLGLI